MTLLVLDEREDALVKLAKDRRLAHKVLFAHRHSHSTPDFQYQIIDRFHSPIRNVCEVAFRGSAKSTIAEEALCLRGSFREFKHALIVGSSFDKAAERLHAIRRQFEKNERLIALFGELRGQPWGDDKLELSTGVVFQAMGRGQAIRGTKSEDTRPDFILCDDIEDRLSCGTPEGREKVQNWFFTELLPAGDEPTLQVRVLCNDMGVECLANRLKHPDSGFDVHVYPWVYQDEDGVERPLWPDRFPMEHIEKKRRQMFALGRHSEYNQEYMCRSEAPEDKPFKRDMIREFPEVRTWQASYAAFDPARTVTAGACETGHAAWSWISNRLVVWEAWGRKLLPDEIISSMFESQAEHRHALVGVDEVGLNEFLLQPVRHEQVKRGMVLPLRALHPARSKTERIRALQPFFNAREVVFAKPLPELQAQLIAFPSGKRDILDALAYSLVMRPGAPIYEDFTGQNVVEGLRPVSHAPLWLCFNATPHSVTAMAVQFVNGVIRILGDWAREGEPATVVPDMVSLAGLELQRDVRVIVPASHFDRYHNVGLVQAFRRMAREVRRGTVEAEGREIVRQHLRRVVKGAPALLIGSDARWTLNGFAGGYCRATDKRGVLADGAEEGVYRTLIEGLESFAGLLRTGAPDDEDRDLNYAFTNDGRRYISARAQR